MRSFLETYGIAIFTIIILGIMVLMANGVGLTIEDLLKGEIKRFANRADTEFQEGMGNDIESLQEKYDFKYYSTLTAAINDINNNTIGENADVTKENAVAGIYTDEDGNANAVLLKNTTESARLKPSVNMTINLGGNVLSVDDAVGINVLSGNLVIDGQIKGSEITINRDANGSCVQVPSTSTATSLTVIGGVYSPSSQTGTATGINHNNTSVKLVVKNCKINSISNGTYAYGINNRSNDCIIDNCDITVKAIQKIGIAVSNTGQAIISNSNMLGYSNYITADGSYSTGVYNTGTITLNNCYALGTHSGVSSSGVLTIDGGTYESFGHGGAYITGSNKTSYIRNATLKYIPMPNGYSETVGTNYAGLYIGGGSSCKNLNAYIDNCKITGSKRAIVLRGTDGEQDNSLYISNSKINLNYTETGIRIDNDTLKLYIGSGNNFTADDSNRPTSVITTNEVYVEN